MNLTAGHPFVYRSYEIDAHANDKIQQKDLHQKDGLTKEGYGAAHVLQSSSSSNSYEDFCSSSNSAISFSSESGFARQW